MESSIEDRYVQRFWRKVRTSDGCWEWTAGTTSGYGLMYIHGRPVKAHRLSWMLHNGPIPDGLFVCHHCDTPRCIRPDHLFLGTAADNCHDRDRKGRFKPLRGAANGAAKLTEQDVIEIRRLYAEGMSQRKIARQFGVSEFPVYEIVNRKSWTNIP